MVLVHCFLMPQMDPLVVEIFATAVCYNISGKVHVRLIQSDKWKKSNPKFTTINMFYCICDSILDYSNMPKTEHCTKA